MKVSVIIPVYNTVSSTFEGLLKSVLNQTERDFELIVIDDGSRPEYACYLDDVARIDSRIRVSHYANGGNHAARYRGIAEAVGDWIYICDADDFLHPQLLEYCLWAAQSHRADFVAFRYEKTIGNVVLNVKPLGNFAEIPLSVVDKYMCNGRNQEFQRALSAVHIDNWAQFMRSALAKSLPPVFGTSDITRTLRLIRGSNIWVSTRAKLYYYNCGESGGITLSPLRLERIIDSQFDWRHLIELYSDERIHGDPKGLWELVCRGYLLINVKIVCNWIRHRKLCGNKEIFLSEFAKSLHMIFHDYGIPLRWCKIRQRIMYWLIMKRYGQA